MRKRTLIGLAACTSQNGAVRCGGAVVSGARNSQAANFQNTRQRTSKKTSLKTHNNKRKRNRGNYGTCAVSVAKKWVTPF